MGSTFINGYPCKSEVVEKFEKAFAKSDKTDAILVVGEKKMHVNKALLSYHSDYFNTLFNSEFKEKSMEEIEIKDVHYGNFATLLSLVHGTPLEINCSNAEYLLKLADQFLLHASKLLVENFIISSQNFDRRRKLVLAEKYKLENLLEHAIGKTKMTETPVLSIYEKWFAKSDKTDAILVVDGKKLHVNKTLLSYHSDYFNTLFNSEFKEKSMEEIEIKDVKFKDFAMLLSLVHDTPVEIIYANAENLLKLADRFLLRAPKLQLERFIINSPTFHRRQKLILADRYNLENLLEHALGLYNNRAAFQDFCSRRNTDISDKLKVKMFDEYFTKYGFSI